MNEPLSCSQFQYTLSYMIPDGTPPINMPLKCVEINEALMYSIPANPEVFDNIILENLQYFRLDVAYTGTPLVNPYSKLYLLYKGNNVIFNGADV